MKVLKTQRFKQSFCRDMVAPLSQDIAASNFRYVRKSWGILIAWSLLGILQRHVNQRLSLDQNSDGICCCCCCCCFYSLGVSPQYPWYFLESETLLFQHAQADNLACIFSAVTKRRFPILFAIVAATAAKFTYVDPACGINFFYSFWKRPLPMSTAELCN